MRLLLEAIAGGGGARVAALPGRHHETLTPGLHVSCAMAAIAAGDLPGAIALYTQAIQHDHSNYEEKKGEGNAAVFHKEDVRMIVESVAVQLRHVSTPLMIHVNEIIKL